MNSLYWRIFLSFWLAAALILVITVTLVVTGEQQKRFTQTWTQRAELYAQATQAFETGGEASLRQWAAGLDPAVSALTFVTDSQGKEMRGRAIPDYLRDLPQRLAAASQSPILRPTIRTVGGPLVLVGADGRTYHVMVGPLRSGPHIFGELEMPGVSIATLLIAIIVSAVVCFFLARYLVAPVDQLRRATRQIAAGKLDVRVSKKLRGRSDELGLLAADLDTMSERVRNLLESKQQLLRDVSHELRSPLARLQLALSLVRRDEGGQADRHLERIEREADRLEQLIARTLKLASLERPMLGIERVVIDLAELLTNIVTDVGIEADAHGCGVTLDKRPPLRVAGDRELLRSALENVIRNAVRYAPRGSGIDVVAVRQDERIEVVIRDSGPGVPEKDLELIFEPFYRVDAARNRAVGGDGLGLAIAARAVSLHGGSIRAHNVSSGGLAVQIVLPAVDARSEPLPAAADLESEHA